MMRTREAHAKGRLDRRAAGMTFLEVVFASATLGMIVAAMTSAINFMIARESRLQHRLACAEVAHRLIIMHLDEPDGMPNESLPIDYGGDYYRWESELEAVDMVPVQRDRFEARSGDLTLKRFRQFTVHVWLAEDSGGDRELRRGVPNVSLTRVYDQLPPNPDSLEKLIDSEEGLRELIQIITGEGGEQ